MCSALENEARILKKLSKRKINGVPAFLNYGTTDNYKYMCMESLGPSLFDLM